MTTLQCISPVNGEVYASREALTYEAAEQSVRQVQAAQPAWSQRPMDERIALVLKGVENLGAMNNTIVEQLAWQMGRPVRYGGEFSGVRERSERMAELAPEALAPHVVEHSEHFERRVERRARGVVLVIAPWNYPYMTAINTLVPALIAGNTVVLKHSTQTILVGEHLAQAFYDAGIPHDVFRNLFLDHAVCAGLIRKRYFGYVNFTGSVGGGRAIARVAAESMTPVGLELGGKDPGYVMEDADCQVAAETLIDGAMFNTGQCCCGIERIYVAESLFDAFVEKAVEVVSHYRLGNPLEQETTLGPMAHRRFAETVRAQVAQAKEQGARALIAPSAFPQDDGGAYLAPQILVGVDHSMAVMREESFGPVVGLMRVRNDDEALQLMNDSRYGLTASLWTRDAERAAALGQRIETGTVFMNRCDYLDPSLCWTGCKDTGYGAGLSVLGYHSVTRPQSFHLKTL